MAIKWERYNKRDNLPTLWVQANTECRILSLEAIQSFWKLYALHGENQLLYNFFQAGTDSWHVTQKNHSLALQNLLKLAVELMTSLAQEHSLKSLYI